VAGVEAAAVPPEHALVLERRHLRDADVGAAPIRVVAGVRWRQWRERGALPRGRDAGWRRRQQSVRLGLCGREPRRRAGGGVRSGADDGGGRSGGGAGGRGGGRGGGDGGLRVQLALAPHAGLLGPVQALRRRRHGRARVVGPVERLCQRGYAPAAAARRRHVLAL